MIADESLEEYLTQCGLTWQVMPEGQHITLCNEWDSVNRTFGELVNSRRQVRYKEGSKAQFEYSHQSAESFMIVPFLGDVGGLHSINKRGPRKAAYECHGDGTLPDLGAFARTDFFIAPPDLNWTMIRYW